MTPTCWIIAGPNGAGKTNVMEAISLLAPGRGLRGAKLAEFQKFGCGVPWAVSGRLTEPRIKGPLPNPPPQAGEGAQCRCCGTLDLICDCPARKRERGIIIYSAA